MTATRKCAAWIGCGNLEVPVSQISFRGFCPVCEAVARGVIDNASTAFTIVPAELSEMPVENLLRGMIDNAASAVSVTIDGVEYELRLKARAYAPKPQSQCPCAICDGKH